MSCRLCHCQGHRTIVLRTSRRGLRRMVLRRKRRGRRVRATGQRAISRMSCRLCHCQGRRTIVPRRVRATGKRVICRLRRIVLRHKRRGPRRRHRQTRATWETCPCRRPHQGSAPESLAAPEADELLRDALTHTFALREVRKCGFDFL
jgi:hypothetical protein